MTNFRKEGDDIAKYIIFNSAYVSQDGIYRWEPNVKYGIVKENASCYYIRRHKKNLQPVPKEDENRMYMTGEHVKGLWTQEH